MEDLPCGADTKRHKEPRGADAPRRTETGERRTERPYGATGEAVAQSGGNRKGQAPKPLSFQASTKGARPARRACRGMAGFARHALGKGADAPWQRRRRAGDAVAAGAPLRGDRRGAVQSGVSRRPICPIGPICPTAASKTASVGETQMFRRFARKTFGSSQILVDLGELTQAGRMQGGAALSPLPYYIADVEAICLLGKGGGRVCGGAFKGAF